MKPLFEIAAFGSFESMRDALKNLNTRQIDTIVSHGGYTLAGEASGYGNLDTLNALADRGVDLNACDRDLGGEPPIHCAIVQNHVEVIRYLLHKKVDLKSLGWMGRTGLEMLIKDGRFRNLVHSESADGYHLEKQNCRLIVESANDEL